MRFALRSISKLERERHTEKYRDRRDKKRSGERERVERERESEMVYKEREKEGEKVRWSGRGKGSEPSEPCWYWQVTDCLQNWI